MEAKISNKSKIIIIEDNKIKATSSRLEREMCKCYEAGIRDARKFCFWKFFSAPFAVFLALLMPLIAGGFKGIGSVSGDTLNIVGWVLCAISFVLGIVMFLMYNIRREADFTTERDKIVSDIIQNFDKDLTK